MAKKESRNKTADTVKIIYDSKRKGNKEYHARAGILRMSLTVLFLLVVALICYAVYCSIVLPKFSEQNQIYAEQLAQLKAENQTLLAEKGALETQKTALETENTELLAGKQTLEAEVASLTETVEQQQAENQAREAAEAEEYIPKGFPLDGSAQMKADDDEVDNMTANEERKEVIFQAEDGANVAATGKGLVIAVEEDEDYGNLVSIDHGNGYISFYRNGASSVVRVGDEVERGELLFVTGKKTTELGYSISKDGSYIDPLEMIEING